MALFYTKGNALVMGLAYTATLLLLYLCANSSVSVFCVRALMLLSCTAMLFYAAVLLLLNRVVHLA